MRRLDALGSDVGSDLGSGIWDRIGSSVHFYRGTALRSHPEYDVQSVVVELAAYIKRST